MQFILFPLKNPYALKARLKIKLNSYKKIMKEKKSRQFLYFPVFPSLNWPIKYNFLRIKRFGTNAGNSKSNTSSSKSTIMALRERHTK